jgi:hypothetical protein
MVVGAVVVAVAGFAAGYAARGWIDPQQAGPAACSHPSLPSGDAARVGGQMFVCTDGTWVHVAGYGNGS